MSRDAWAKNPMRIPRILSIAGTDPTGGAGIQADLKSIAANGGYGMAVTTALVAQNTRGVRSVHLPPVSFLAEQLDAVSDDVNIDAVKIGMLANAEIIETVAGWLDRVRPSVVVLDPVMVATSGDILLDPVAVAALRELARRADLVTPNLAELAALDGSALAESWPQALAQAISVSARLGVRVLAKGGHLDGTTAPDALVDARDSVATAAVVEFTSPRIRTGNTHGTGCSLSSALATRLALAETWEPAIEAAKRWLTESIAAADALEVGHGAGPINHFAGLWERGGVPSGSITGQWWHAVADVRSDIRELEFIRRLADGTLARDAFVWYLAQDALYLRDYARVLAEASRLAPTAEEAAFWASCAGSAIEEELRLHAAWLPDGALFDARPSPVTTAYINHLLAAGSRGEYAVLAAALLPCFWLYHDVGQSLFALAVDGHPYRGWLENYASPEFDEANARAVEIVSRVVSTSSSAVRERAWTAFRRSSEHERAFFEAPLARIAEE